MQDDQATALGDYMQRVRNTARGLRQPYISQDDLVGAGMVALTRCLDLYDPQRGEFWPWAVRRVRGAMIDLLREWRGRSLRASTIPIPDDEEGPGCLVDDLQRDLAAEIDFRDALAKLRPPRLAEVFLRRELLGESLEEIAAREGVSGSRISQLYTVACRRLQKALRS